MTDIAMLAAVAGVIVAGSAIVFLIAGVEAAVLAAGFYAAVYGARFLYSRRER